MTHNKRITQAKLDWRAINEAASAPHSIVFDDIYFATDGPAETNHVFLQGNTLPARFEEAAQFTIGELGFGTGLNLLCAWNAWNAAAKPTGAQLHFFSVEAYPLSIEDMAKAHENWPDFKGLSAVLRTALPPPQPGFHCVHLSSDVSLTLYYGEALEGLRQTEARVDAWFLDGFAPAKNPAMWAPELFEEAARLSNTNASFATFTVAGAVRRALQSTGFSVEKRPGFGKKREMLTGRLEGSPPQKNNRKPWFATRQTSTITSGAKVAIIGAGIAGASLAYALDKAGLKPTVYEAKAPASGASGNPAGLVMPRLDVGDTPAGRFHAHAYLYTLRLLKTLQQNSTENFFNSCGVLYHAKDKKERVRQEKLLTVNALPEGWMTAHQNGLFFPQAGTVTPKEMVLALLGDTPLHSEKVLQLTRPDGRWLVHTASDAECFDAVIIANGLDALRFTQVRTLPLNGSAGQVEYFPEASSPPHAHAFGPYAAPAPTGGVVLGATYAPHAPGETPLTNLEATRSNLEAVGGVLPEVGDFSPDASRPRASVRCVTPDRLPVVGPVPAWGFYGGAYDDLREGKKRDYPSGETEPGLYVLTGLGSRGLITAPLAAAMLASEMTAAPAPVDRETAEALHPARFFIRELKRARPAPQIIR